MTLIFKNSLEVSPKFQLNRLFVVLVQCTLQLVFVISGGRGTLKFAVASTQCVVYVLRNLWSKFGSLSDEYRQLKKVFRTNFVLR